MNPQDQNTYVGPPPRAIDPNAPQDPYLAQAAAPVQPPYPDPNQPQPYPDPNQPYMDPAQPYPQAQPAYVEAEPEQPAYNPNQYNTPQLSAQIQMAQQAGVQAGQIAQAQTVSAQMAAQQTPPIKPETEDAKQTYKAPLVISNSVARAFAYVAILTIIMALVNFIVKQFSTEFGSSPAYATILTVLNRVNTITLFARIACVGFAVAATVIRVYNPHPYNTKNAIAGWVFAILSLVALIIFK